MGMDFKQMMAVQQALTGFINRHPKVAPFAQGVKSHGAVVGQEIAIAIRYPDGTEYKTGVRLQQEDLDMLQNLKAQR